MLAVHALLFSLIGPERDKGGIFRAGGGGSPTVHWQPPLSWAFGDKGLSDPVGRLVSP